jgi:hypothetical protein
MMSNGERSRVVVACFPEAQPQKGGINLHEAVWLVCEKATAKP